MKRVGKPWFFVVALVIFALAYFTFFGAYGVDEEGNEKTFVRGVKDIRWGTDIQGGVSVTFGPKSDVDATDLQMSAVKATLESRLVNSGVTDYELFTDNASDRIMISFPWKDGQVQDPKATIDELSATNQVMDQLKEMVPMGQLELVPPKSGNANHIGIRLSFTRKRVRAWGHSGKHLEPFLAIDHVLYVVAE